jgi:phosphatidylglycerophosphate synthase
VTGTVTQTATGSVGNAAARVVHGWTRGAHVVVLGEPTGRVVQALADLDLVPTSTPEGGPVAAQLAALAGVLPGAVDRPVVLVAGDLDIESPALLDLLDRPGVRTAALVADPLALGSVDDAVTMARVGRDGRLLESVGTAAHRVGAPTHVLPGVVRIDGADREVAARLVRDALAHVEPEWGDDTLGIVTLALARGGLPVQASALGPFRWHRRGSLAAGAEGDAWRQRLRGASRGGDGFFSTYAVRPLSRRLTGVGLARGWSPNVVTVVSLLAGVAAAGLVATGWWWAWVVAAVVLLLALVVDCVDGEIARFTRRFSPLGAFLDAVGDRVKEYAVLAAVAAVAVREGSPGWPVALAAMAVVTVRHLEDYAYEHRLGHGRRSRPDLLPIGVPDDSRSGSGRTTLPAAPTRRQQVVHWTKKVVHMPIAERYLLIALTLLTRRPMLVLWALVVAVAVAVLWTQGGRVVAVLVRRDHGWGVVPRPATRDHLDEQLDLGPLATAAGAVVRTPFAVGLLGAVLLIVAVPWLLWVERPWAALAVAAVTAVLVGTGWRPPVHHPLGWQAPAALWVAEVLVAGVLVHQQVGAGSAAGFAYLAAVAYHRYDVVYRLRDTGVAPPRWVVLGTLGTEGRVLVLVLLAAVAPGAVVPFLWVASVVLAVVFLAESVHGWRTWIAGQDSTVRTGARP